MSVAACPLIAKATRGARSLCGDVRCTECDLLDDHLREVGGVEKVCSGCLDDKDGPLGFQMAGKCERCGRHRRFLMPVKPP
jgi:hypothetical protein